MPVDPHPLWTAMSPEARADTAQELEAEMIGADQEEKEDLAEAIETLKGLGT